MIRLRTGLHAEVQHKEALKNKKHSAPPEVGELRWVICLQQNARGGYSGTLRAIPAWALSEGGTSACSLNILILSASFNSTQWLCEPISTWSAINVPRISLQTHSETLWTFLVSLPRGFLHFFPWNLGLGHLLITSVLPSEHEDSFPW